MISQLPILESDQQIISNIRPTGNTIPLALSLLSVIFAVVVMVAF